MPDHRLPTRVGKACDRCRRQKQRCDPFRPCSNCMNTNRECVTREATTPSTDRRPAKRSRTAPRNFYDSDDDVRPSDNRKHVVDTNQSGNLESERREPLTPTDSRRRSNLSPDMRGDHESIVSRFGDSTSAVDITKRVLQESNHSRSADRATFAIPGGDSHHQDTTKYYSVEALITISLLPKEVCDNLVDAYFFTVHWFSLVVYEPSFRARYHKIIDTNTARLDDRPFLLLLIMVLAMACHYGANLVDENMRRSINFYSIRDQYLKIVRQNFMDLLDEDSLEFVQICTLLGSHWLYWGKPKSSFIILGTTIKAAQAISLHRPCSRGCSFQMMEERRRVWWTIYTWDRFATIIYGRPLGINDRDCDVEMPTLFSERVVDTQKSESVDLCLSQYQVLLNQVYHIASPLLENIYGIRFSSDDELLSQMPKMVEHIEIAMHRWYHELPHHLDLDQSSDLCSESMLQDKLHMLQALSLQLTYENLVIITHRPLLLDWTHRREQASRRASLAKIQQPPTETTKALYDTSLGVCLKAALKISRIQQSKPNLIRLARRTHLLSFLGMNLFTSSVVLFISTLSDVLSDTASEAKRGLRRNLKVLKSLSNFGSLSSQCTAIIEDLVQLIVEKEKEQMLCASPSTEPDEDLSHSAGGQFDQNRELQQDRILNYEFDATKNLRQNFASTYNDAAMTFGKTMETLQKVLKDPSNARIPQRPENPLTEVVQAQIQPEMPLWSPSWQDTPIMGDNSLMQDMGQFWLWEAGSGTGDLGQAGFDLESYTM